MPFANGPILKLSKLEHLVSPLQISAVTRVPRTRVTLVTLHSRRHSAWLPTRIQHDLPLWIRTRTQSRLARNFTSQSLKLTQWNRQAHSSGMLPIVRSGPRQVKLVQTTRSSRTTPNADQSFWELQQKKTNMCQALQILMLFLNSPLSNSPKPKLAKRCICNATSKSASSSKTVNQRAVNVKMVISVCKQYSG